jgi:hypothetical protein
MPDSSRAGLFERLKRHRTPHTVRYRVVHFGFYSSAGLLLLMIINMMFTPGFFAQHYESIGILYLVIQGIELLWRDPLNWAEVAEGAAFALAPAILSLVAVVLANHSNAMNFWFWISWFCFVMNFALGLKIPATAYERKESPLPPS